VACHSSPGLQCAEVLAAYPKGERNVSLAVRRCVAQISSAAVMDRASERPSWDAYFMSIAQLAKERSPSSRLQVGCLLVVDNRIVAQGYNGFLPGLPHARVMRDGHEINTVHAEQNAVADCARRGVACAGATAYVTHSPCIHCTKALLAAGIVRVCFAEAYRLDAEAVELFRLAEVPLEHLHGGGESMV